MVLLQSAVKSAVKYDVLHFQQHNILILITLKSKVGPPLFNMLPIENNFDYTLSMLSGQSVIWPVPGC